MERSLEFLVQVQNTLRKGMQTFRYIATESERKVLTTGHEVLFSPSFYLLLGFGLPTIRLSTT